MKSEIEQRMAMTVAPFKFALLAAAIGIAGVVSALPARAATVDQEFRCMGLGPNRPTEQQRIDACTTQIQSARESKSRRAAYVNRGNAYAHSGELDRAIADYTEALKIDPTETAYRNRGIAYEHKGELDRAIADYDAVIKLKPEDPFGYYARGDVYFTKGDLDRAIADYSEAIKRNPKYAKAYRQRGATYQFMGELQRAIADFSEVITLEPNDNDFFLRAKAYQIIGDNERAAADYRKVHEISPNRDIDRLKEDADEWVRYLKEIAEDDDYPNRSPSALAAFRGAKTK
jgi:tetratricopeptide (TPR) repeat protein